MSSSKTGKKYSDETRAKMSSAQKGLKVGVKHPMFGKPKPEGSGRPSQKIEVIDIKNNITTIYNSISLVALALDTKPSRISMFFRRN